MDLSSVISEQSARQAEKQALYVSQLFDNHSDLSEIFTRLASEEPELCQQILSKSESSVKSWFLNPDDYLHAIQTLGLLAPVYGPEPEPESLSQTWLLPVVRCCLNSMEHAFQFDSETASRKVAIHLLSLNSAFKQCKSLEQTRQLLHVMFADEQLHWSLFVN